MPFNVKTSINSKSKRKLFKENSQRVILCFVKLQKKESLQLNLSPFDNDWDVHNVRTFILIIWFTMSSYNFSFRPRGREEKSLWTIKHLSERWMNCVSMTVGLYTAKKKERWKKLLIKEVWLGCWRRSYLKMMSTIFKKKSNFFNCLSQLPLALFQYLLKIFLESSCLQFSEWITPWFFLKLKNRQKSINLSPINFYLFFLTHFSCLLKLNVNVNYCWNCTYTLAQKNRENF